jgi:ANTAR domain/GAF domain
MEFNEIGDVVDRESFTDFARDFSESARILFAAGSVTATLEQVVEVAVETIEGCDLAGLFINDGKSITSPSTDGSTLQEIDALQYETGEGPCLDAIEHRLIFYADDLQTDLRWPQFAPRATSAGLRSVLALPFGTAEAGGALNLYARYPAAFGVVDRGKGVILASMAGLALSAAHNAEDQERLAANLHTALTSRELIGQAEGILMEREKITAHQAFDVLRRASQHLNLKLRDVAQTLVDTGERPETGDRAARPPK